VSTSRFLGILCFSAALYAQAPLGDFHHLQVYDEPAPGVPSAFAPLVPDWPEHAASQPISGVVSLRELEHPVSWKAVRAAYDAQQFSRANKIPQAIKKLEKAIHIAPLYRDAHWNLGVMYAWVGRSAEARAEFQKALDIGPPAAQLYANLAVTCAAAGEVSEAVALARKAIELDPRDSIAQRLLKSSALKSQP
jgi:tetratricopeptide (TPR) repeat protein